MGRSCIKKVTLFSHCWRHLKPSLTIFKTLSAKHIVVTHICSTSFDWEQNIGMRYFATAREKCWVDLQLSCPKKCISMEAFVHTKLLVITRVGSSLICFVFLVHACVRDGCAHFLQRSACWCLKGPRPYAPNNTWHMQIGLTNFEWMSVQCAFGMQRQTWAGAWRARMYQMRYKPTSIVDLAPEDLEKLRKDALLDDTGVWNKLKTSPTFSVSLLVEVVALSLFFGSVGSQFGITCGWNSQSHISSGWGPCFRESKCSLFFRQCIRFDLIATSKWKKWGKHEFEHDLLPNALCQNCIIIIVLHLAWHACQWAYF